MFWYLSDVFLYTFLEVQILDAKQCKFFICIVMYIKKRRIWNIYIREIWSTSLTAPCLPSSDTIGVKNRRSVKFYESLVIIMDQMKYKLIFQERRKAKYKNNNQRI